MKTKLTLTLTPLAFIALPVVEAYAKLRGG